MRKIKLLFAAALSMIAWTGVMAQTAEEYEAALAAIEDGAVYYVKTDVGGTYYYLKGNGTLTATQTEATEFIFQKTAGAKYDFGFKLNNNGTFFSNPPGTSDDALNCGYISTSTRGDASWEAQVFFLNSDGKYAVRAGNVEDTGGWSHVASSYWTVVIGEADPVAQYQWEANYCWELEKDELAPSKVAALATVQAWPFFIQSAKGLVKDASKFYSNAKEPSEGSYEALIDDEYTTFFHSAWSVSVEEAHYLQAELSEATQKFQFYFKKRSQNNNNRPTTMVVSASNDGENFTEVTTLDEGFPTEASVIDYMSSVVDLGAAYKYVRFTVTATNSGSKFFTFSEFYLYPDAVEQLAPIYNNYATKAWSDLTEEDIAQINAVDAAMKAAISTVNVTYVLQDADGTVIETKEVVQEPNSEVNIPTTWLSNTKFYDYTVSGTIGTSDCTITVTRTLKAGFVGTLADLSNTKAYTITCDRGAMLTNGETIASTSNSAYADAEPGQFALVNYDGNYYLYSVADAKFVLNNGYLADKIANGVFDALQMTPMTTPYFMYYYTVAEGTNYGVNTNGSGNLGGIVINSWMNADPGNQYYMVEAADFDPTAALAALDAYFNPSFTVTYVVKDTEGNVIFTSDPEPSEEGAIVTTLPAKYQRAYYTYDEVNVTVTEPDTKAEFTATWDGPFTISPDFENANWYNMTMRGTWYVTTDVKDGDGAYKTQNANIMGLGEDSYQWAFIGNGYDGFKIINKAEGNGKSFGWTDATKTNAGIPTVMADEEGYHAWKIVASTNTSVPAGSFCLNVPGTDLYINQYGGAGGSVKFWNSANNIGDPGSAFTVYDVLTDFSEYVVSDVAPAMEATGYFTFTDAAKAAIGYDPAYKESCPFDTFKSMMAKIKEALNDVNNFILPGTGYYTLTSKMYGTFMGIDPSDANVYGNYKTANAAKQVVKLTKTGNATYTISLMGKFAPATVAQSGQVTFGAEAGTYTAIVPAVGYAAFSPTPESQYTYLHCASGGSVVGWEPTADATQWAVADAASINLTIGEAGYATAYLPFPVEVGKTLSVPAAVGTWTFDDGTTGSLIATEGVTIADGVATVPVGDYLTATDLGAAANSGTYTIMFDIKAANVKSYCCLFNNDRTKDGSLFFNKGKLGLNTKGLGYNGAVEADTWYRVVFVSEDAYVYAYLDGVLVGQSTQGADEDHWKLGSELYFFADDDGEEQEISANELRFWDVALTADEVAMLGAYGDVIPEPTSVVAYTAQIAENTSEYGTDYKYLALTELEGTIPAYTAVVLKGEPAVYEFAIDASIPDGALGVYDDEVDGGQALVKEEVLENNVLKGTLEPIDAAGKYVLAKPEGKEVCFYQAEGGKIAAGKAYFEFDSDVKAFYFKFADDPTGIANVEKTVENGLIFNVAGQRLNKMQKGINIVNGKKILY